MVYAHALGACELAHGGSSPLLGTKNNNMKKFPAILLSLFLFIALFIFVFLVKLKLLPDIPNQNIIYEAITNPVISKLVESAISQTKSNVTYDPAYYDIDYPNGVVPSNVGVCSDVIIRAFKDVDLDLQKEVHEDMASNFKVYPNLWGLTSTDKNIDHRRVPNLQTYFQRKNYDLPVTDDANDYAPGDVVVWRFANGRVHTGLVVNALDLTSQRYLIVHNAGRGPQLENVLFAWEIIGHYRIIPS